MNKDFMCSMASPAAAASAQSGASGYSLPPAYSAGPYGSSASSSSVGCSSSSWSLMPTPQFSCAASLVNASSAANGANGSNGTGGSCFLQASQSDHEDSECDQANHLWFCLKDYTCAKMEEFMHKLRDYICIQNNKSELILVHTAHPVFEFKDVLSEARRILCIFLSKSITGKPLEELISKKFPVVAREHIENLLNKFLNVIYIYIYLLAYK